ncbi:MAG: ATP-binding protein [Bacillota bacterium]
MSIRARLILSYIGMIIIPTMLIITLNYISANYTIDEKSGLSKLINPIHLSKKLNEKSNDIHREMNITALRNVDQLNDISYIQSLDKELEELLYVGIVLRKDDEIIYRSPVLMDEKLSLTLPAFQEAYHDEKIAPFKIKYHIYSQYDFYTTDKSKNSLFLILNVKLARRDFLKDILVQSILVIGILIFTTLLLTASVYRDISHSIRKLKKASNEIKNGNMDYAVKPHLNDEIGELSMAFEEMRVRLKDSLDMQTKYEENRRKLISNISHDLRTPIMSIKGYIEGIKDGIADSPEKMEKYTDTIYKKACDMETLINELFLFSKLDLKEISFDFQPVNIIDYLKFCVEDLEFELEKKGGSIRLHHENMTSMVLADVQNLQRVIMNIIENAIKYMGETPLNIDMNVKEQSEQVLVEIKDNGKGISAEDLPFIFDRFYRADKSRNTSIGGSGLGLAISKQIIEKHGGSIWAESEINKGTSIFFTLRKVEGGESE